jgi:2-oxoisovalerate dehydrogenase E1 component beta subunit
MTTTTMTMIQALRSAMDVMLERDDNVVVFGQDVGYFGGVFRCTEGLQTKYGTSRVFDAPISKAASSAPVGMGAYGLRPVARSSSPTTSTRPPTRSSPRPRACVIARPASSPRR